MKGFWGVFDFWEVGFFVDMECIGKWDGNMGECNNDNYNNNGFGEIEEGGSELGFHVFL